MIGIFFFLSLPCSGLEFSIFPFISLPLISSEFQFAYVHFFLYKSMNVDRYIEMDCYDHHKDGTISLCSRSKGFLHFAFLTIKCVGLNLMSVFKQKKKNNAILRKKERKGGWWKVLIHDDTGGHR
jgi:hypothetical protein